MTRARQWPLGAGIFLGVLALLAVVVARLIPPDEELARRASGELEAALGVPVSIGALHWRLLPSPSVVIEDAATGQPQPIEVKRLTAWLDMSALWQRRLKVERAQVAGAVLPQLSLRGLGGQPAASGQQAKPFTLDGLPLARIEFRDVTWVSRRGTRLVYDGEADFDAGWRPRTAALRRPGTSPPAEMALACQGQDDRWEVKNTVGGGTAHGDMQLQTGADGGLRLAGKLQPRHIDIVSTLQAFGRRSVVAGKLAGDTTLSARGSNRVDIAWSLHTTTTRFSVGPATLLRFNVGKAIRSLGREHDGSTPLDAISGQIDTQNTPQGMVVTFTGLKMRSGALSATGKARVANRQIDAELAVDLVDGVICVPLTLSGPVDKVRVAVPPSALAGAAVGTAVLPGVGTAIGARIGSAIGKLLGSEPEDKRRLAPVEK